GGPPGSVAEIGRRAPEPARGAAANQYPAGAPSRVLASFRRTLAAPAGGADRGQRRVGRPGPSARPAEIGSGSQEPGDRAGPTGRAGTRRATGTDVQVQVRVF